MLKLFGWVILLALLAGPAWLLVTGQVHLNGNWQTADRSSAHLAQPAEQVPEAVIQVYSARAFNWRGLLAAHTWIAVKPENAKTYTVLQVVGWRRYRGLPSLAEEPDIPDRLWFNQRPKIIYELKGPQAAALVPKILAAAQAYPYANAYVLWPGPNSNTFVAYIGRSVPELELAMPPDAIGKDFYSHFPFVARAPSGTGYQFSLFGLFGILLAREEGFEVNILSLVFGLNPYKSCIIWPAVGCIYYR